MTQAAPTCLITRPEPDGSRFAARLRDHTGLETVLSPLMAVKTLPVSIQMDSFATVILTSPAAARCLETLGIPKKRHCLCVGDKTAQTARAAGYTAVSAGGTARELTTLLTWDPGRAPYLYLRGADTTGDICATLTAQGLECVEVIVYKQEKQDFTAAATALLSGSRPVVLPLFSPRSARIAAPLAAASAFVHPVAISPAVAAAWPADAPRAATVAQAPTEDAVLEAIYRLPVVKPWVEMPRLQS
ncbi:MAG: uroporphyrinogen-III synthase [Pseudomonadota bacterium]